MSAPVEILFVDDEEHLRISACQTLELAGFAVRATDAPAEALAQVTRAWRGIIVSDIRMPGMDGMELLRQVMAIDSDLPVLLVTGHGDVSLAVEAMRAGAYDFIEKPFDKERFLDSIGRAVEKRELTLENRQLRETAASRPDALDALLAGRSDIMAAVRRKIRAVAETPADVLIVGETGTGKEIAARAIHDLSHDRERPFLTIDCAALSPDMVEAELFGYEAGAFNGATRARFGKLEHARNGTIFLDRAHAMSREMQAKLLRVIQDRAITRLGGGDPIDLNCRFIAASNVDLEDSDGQVFSRDLLYRLNAVTLRLPPLSLRMEDVPALFHQFVGEAAIHFRRNLPPAPSDAMLSRLLNREWPGNVRELRNAAERYVLGIEDDGTDPSMPETSARALKDRVLEFEREAIASELRASNGNLKPVYETLGLSRKTLYEKMQKYGLSKSEFRNGQ